MTRFQWYSLFLYAVLLVLAGCSPPPDSQEQPVEIDWEAYPEPEDIYGEFGSSRSDQLCDSCNTVNQPIELTWHTFFLDSVYLPAQQDAKVSTGIRNFLDELKAYVERPDSVGDSTFVKDKFLLPIYAYSDANMGLTGNEWELTGAPGEFKRIDAFLWDNGLRTRSYKGVISTPESDSVWKVDSAVWRTYYSPQIEQQIGLPGSNFTVLGPNTHGGGKVKDMVFHYGPCYQNLTYRLNLSRYADTLPPMIGSPYHLKPEYLSDSLLDAQLSDASSCRNICEYCSDEAAPTVFARLAGVRHLYFVGTDKGPFPVRGLVMQINGKYVKYLWRYRIELSECSCI